MIGWNASGGSPDDDIVTNLPLLRERSRDVCMGIPLARGAVECLSTNVVGYGLYPSPNVDGSVLGLNEAECAALNEELGTKFDWWANSTEADYDARLTFYGLTQLAYESMMWSGDTPVMLAQKQRKNSIWNLRVRVVEADRVCDPPGKALSTDLSTYGGVELDNTGETVAYWVAKFHPLARRARWVGNIQDWIRVPAVGEVSGRRNMWLMMRPERPEQRRGGTASSRLFRESQTGRSIRRIDDDRRCYPVVFHGVRSVGECRAIICSTTL
jgi:capsid protein